MQIIERVRAGGITRVGSEDEARTSAKTVCLRGSTFGDKHAADLGTALGHKGVMTHIDLSDTDITAEGFYKFVRGRLLPPSASWAGRRHLLPRSACLLRHARVAVVPQLRAGLQRAALLDLAHEGH